MDPVSPGSPVRILRRAKVGNDSKVTGMDTLQSGKEVSLSPPLLLLPLLCVSCLPE